MRILDKKYLNGLIDLIKYLNLNFHFLINFSYFETKFINKNWGFFFNLINRYSVFIRHNDFSKTEKKNLLREIRILLKKKNILKKIKISIFMKKITKKIYFKKKARTMGRIKKGVFIKNLIIEKTKIAYKKLFGFSFQKFLQKHILYFYVPNLLKKKKIILIFDKMLIDFKNAKINFKIFSLLNQNLIKKFFQKKKHFLFLLDILFKKINFFSN